MHLYDSTPLSSAGFTLPLFDLFTQPGILEILSLEAADGGDQARNENAQEKGKQTGEHTDGQEGYRHPEEPDTAAGFSRGCADLRGRSDHAGDTQEHQCKQAGEQDKK